jgi:hypothetical protein
MKTPNDSRTGSNTNTTAINLMPLLSHFCADLNQPDTFELMALQSYVDRMALQERHPGSRRHQAALELSAALEDVLLRSAHFDEGFLDNYLSVRHAEREILIRYALPSLN